MSTTAAEQAMQTLEVAKQEHIAAPMDVVFETILEQLGPLHELPDGSPMALKLEAWPGGRWYRDLGDNAGQWWGNIQVIKPPVQLEIWGPAFMPNAVVSNIQFRLTEENGVTRLDFAHRAIGQITAQQRERIGGGWAGHLVKIRQAAEGRKGAANISR